MQVDPLGFASRWKPGGVRAGKVSSVIRTYSGPSFVSEGYRRLRPNTERARRSMAGASSGLNRLPGVKRTISCLLSLVDVSRHLVNGLEAKDRGTRPFKQRMSFKLHEEVQDPRSSPQVVLRCQCIAAKPVGTYPRILGEYQVTTVIY